MLLSFLFRINCFFRNYGWLIKHKKIYALIVEGMAGNENLFFLFVLLELFLGFVESGSWFKTLAILM
jgi:hypothetical protein